MNINLLVYFCQVYLQAVLSAPCSPCLSFKAREELLNSLFQRPSTSSLQPILLQKLRPPTNVRFTQQVLLMTLYQRLLSWEDDGAASGDSTIETEEAEIVHGGSY